MSLSKDSKKVAVIKAYLGIKGEKPLFDYDDLSQLAALFSNNEQRIVTSGVFLRKLAAKLGRKAYDFADIYSESERMMAFAEAIAVLAKKQVPVYFFDRVGALKGFAYSDSAKTRMTEKTGFPVMYENPVKYENDLKELFGEKYSQDYVKQIGKIPQVVKVDSFYRHEDCKSEYVNVIKGLRVTPGIPEEYSRTIHFYGRCGAFGYAVEDSENIPAFLQKILNDNHEKIKVINHGLWGGCDEMLDHNFILESVSFDINDIVVFYRYPFEKGMMGLLEKLGVAHTDVTERWHNYPEASWCFYDKPGHMNSIGYKNVAEIIFSDLLNEDYLKNGASFGDVPPIKGILEEYIKKSEDESFEAEIKEYISSITGEKKVSSTNNGAIVMNCNPFTLGHKYLIEYAAKQVDFLYIFVVEEDRSFFKFEDRFKMVLEGTGHLKNVAVVPSGKFIISAYTFPEYFMKDYVKEVNFDVSEDVSIFGKYISPALSVKKRFVGEEPTDPVTNNYNSAMKKILPQYGVELVEIKRAENEKGIISATEVRRLINAKEFDKLTDYIPDSTYRVLKEKYIK